MSSSKVSALPRALPRVPALPLRPAAAAQPLSALDVAVIGINYAPEPTGIAPYTTGMAEHLAERTRSTTVVTGVPHYPNWTVEPRYRRVLRATERDPQRPLTVRRLRHHVPGRQSALTRAAYEASFLANAVSVRLPASPDLIVAVTPSLGGAVAGARLARRHSARLLVVVQDLMAKAAAQSGMSGGGRVAGATARLEQWALSQADEVAIVSEAFRSQLHDYGVPDSRISLLPNWTHISSVSLTTEQARRSLGWQPGGFVVLHTGNIGLKQDLGNMVEAARECVGQPDIRFVIVGDGSQRSFVEAAGAALPNLEFVDPVAGDQYPTVLAAADVLVVNERASVGDMSLPSKLTSYLSAGRPILAAVSDEGATSRELARTSGAALRVPPGDPGQFAAAVRKLCDDPGTRAHMAAAGTSYAERTLSRGAAMTRLEASLQRCLRRP